MPQERNSSGQTIYIRKPAVAGQFYTENPASLKNEIKNFLDSADSIEIPGNLIGFMSPHAGYIYSGPVAGWGYKQIANKEYKTVIVLAPSHHARFSGVSIISSGLYRTPLGDVPIDEEIAKKIISENPDKFHFFQEADEIEHSLEVQIPFLQVALKEGWKLVPIIFGQHDLETSKMAADSIAPHFNPHNHLIIASSDMSHMHPYSVASGMDKNTLEKIESLDIEGLIHSLRMGTGELCGSGAVISLMMFAKALDGKAMIIKYANSGDTAGSKDQVVGYGLVAFYKSESKEEIEYKDTEEKPFIVTDEQKKMLLDMSRKSLESIITNDCLPDFDYKDPILDEKLGLFVTLRKSPSEDLRGCIGHCFPVNSLREDLPKLTASSALDDPRFYPVGKDEIKDINIEISLLSPMKRINDWQKIKIPGHGVYVKRGFRAGVFLPQVADETGWDRETFMMHLCMEKAGLPADSWKDPGTELYIFTATKFSE